MALGWLMSSWLFVGGIGCSGTDNSAEIMEAEKALAGNDFANAETKLAAVLQATPQDPKAATAMAHLHTLKGEYDQALAVLDAVQTEDVTVQSQIALRKALIALQNKDFSKAKEKALTSNEDFAKILAAEISLMDGEYEEAVEYLEKVGGSHKNLAKKYLKLLDGDEWSQAYAEAQALWALRDFDLAIQSVAGTLEFVNKSAVDNQFNEHVVLWASRAVGVANPSVAEQLLSMKGVSSAKDDWRVAVLQAMITAINGNVAGGKNQLEALEGVAPAQALHDARATTVVVLSSIGKDGSSLLGGLRGTSGAYAAYKANDKSRALDMVDSDIFEQFLDGGL